MRLSDILDKNLIFLNLEAKDKTEALEKIVQLMQKNKLIENQDVFLAEVWRRENLGSTAMGEGIALPHARLKGLEKIVIVFASFRNGIDFDAEDKKPVNLIFLLGTPIAMAAEYLEILAKLSKLLRQSDIRQKLLRAGSPSEIIEIVGEAE